MEIRKFIISIVSRFDGRGFKQADAAARKLKGTASEAAEEVEEVDESLRKATKSSRTYARTTKEVETAQRAANKQLRDTKGRFSASGREARKSSRSWKGFGGTLKGTGQALKKAASLAKVAAVAFAAAAAAVAAVAVPVLRTGMEFEQLEVRLTTLLGGTAQAQRAFKVIKDFARDTPFDLQEVTRSFIDLQTRGVDPTRKRLTGLGDLASAFGEDLQSITDAIAAAARGENDPIEKFGVAAKASGDKVVLTFRDQKVAVERTAEAITDVLVKFGEMEGIAGSMEAQSKTLAGQFGNATDALQGFLNTAAQSGAMERVSEILEELQDKFLSDTNARLLGQALDEILTTIRDMLESVDPHDVISAFQLLLKLVQLLLKALKPLIWTWSQMVEAMSKFDRMANRVIKIGGRVRDAFSGMLDGSISLRGGVTELARSFGILSDEAQVTGGAMDELKAKAVAAAEAVQRAVLGALAEGQSDEELTKIMNDTRLPGQVRAAAQKELERRKTERANKQLQEQEKKRTREEQRFDPTADLDKAAQDFGEETAAKEFKRLRKEGVSEEEAKRLASVAGAKAEEEERKRLSEGGDPRKKGKKGGKKPKEDKFFDFESDAEKAAQTQGEEFAAQEFERLRAEGVAVEAALEQSRAAGQKRAEELKKRFLEAGRIFDASADNILDILGLRGPGSVLEGRPPPQTLLITFAPVFKFIETFNQTIEKVDGAKALAEVTGQGGQAAAEAGLDEGYDRFKTMFEAMMGLMIDRLQKADGGGRLPSGGEG